MWEWLRRSSIVSDRNFQMMREGFLEYERLFGRFPLPRIVWIVATFGADTSLSHLPSELTDDQKIDFANRFSAVLLPALKLTGPHAGSLSAATVAWAIRQAVLYAEGKPCLVSPHIPDSCESLKEGGKAPRDLQGTLFDLFGEALRE
jgi:hypothetical protein